MANTREQNERGNYRQQNSGGTLLNVLAAVTLTPVDRVVECTANTATDDYAITLPPVGQCAGMTFTICAILVANSKTATVQDQDDVRVSAARIAHALDETDDAVVVFSNGRQWFTTFTNLS